LDEKGCSDRRKFGIRGWMFWPHQFRPNYWDAFFNYTCDESKEGFVMEGTRNSQHTALAHHIVQKSDDRQLEALRWWADKMLAIRSSNGTKIRKAKSAILASMDKDLIVPVIKRVADEAKRLAWDDRGLKARSALVASTAALMTFGGQGAGIAALGGAIGVPLWVVFGAGGAFAASLYEEATVALGKNQPRTTYSKFIEAEKIEPDLGDE
jgi:hypothetical protein